MRPRFDIQQHSMYPRKYYITLYGKAFKWQKGFISLTLKQAQKLRTALNAEVTQTDNRVSNTRTGKRRIG
jgi:hypothetical protein